MNKTLAVGFLTSSILVVLICLPTLVLGQSEFLSMGESGGRAALHGVFADGINGVQASAGVSHDGWVDVGFHYAYTDGGGAGNNLSSIGILSDFHITRSLAPELPVLVASLGYATTHHNYSKETISGVVIGGGVYYRIKGSDSIFLIPFASIDAIFADGTHGAGSAGVSYAMRSRTTIMSLDLGVGVSEDVTSAFFGIGLARANPIRRWR